MIWSPMKLESASAEETISFGEQLGKRCSGGEIFLLLGDLGGGKTTFIKGLARGMGIGEPVTSPTFVLMNIYNGPLLLCHADLYRLAEIDDVATTGLWDIVGNDDTVAAVEWAGMLLRGGFAPPYITVRFSLGTTENRRIIEVESCV